jgi:hypothetical protein
MKTLLLSSLLSIIFSSTFAQVTLEYKFISQNANNYSSNESINLYQFSSGAKYVKSYKDATTNVMNVTVYNLDYSLNKNFVVNTGCSDLSFTYALFYITDKLFDTDNDYEVCLVMTASGSSSTINTCYGNAGTFTNAYIYNDDNTLLFKSDTSTFADFDYSGGFGRQDQFRCIYNTSSGAKMLLTNNNGTYIYSLPGSITTSTIKQEDVTQYAYQISPNPTNTYTKIDFELPANEIGTICIYDVAGNIIKNYQVDNTFGNLVVNNQDFITGTYFYTITSPSVRQTKKVIVIK